MANIHADYRSTIINSIPCPDSISLFGECRAAVSRVQAIFVRNVYSDDSVAEDLYSRLKDRTVIPENLRHYTLGQLGCLKEKIQKNPPRDVETEQCISEVFSAATRQAHYFKQSEELQIALWDIYTTTGQAMKKAISLFASSGSQEKQESVRKAMTKLFAKEFFDVGRCCFIDVFSCVAPEQEAYFTLLEPYFDSLSRDMTDVLKELQKIAPTHQEDILKTVCRIIPKKTPKSSYIEALASLEQSERAPVLELIQKFYPNSAWIKGPARELAAIAPDQRERVIATAKRFFPYKYGSELASIINALATVGDENEEILQFIISHDPGLDGYELKNAIKAFAHTEQKQRAHVLELAAKHFGERGRTGAFLIALELAQTQPADTDDVLENVLKFLTPSSTVGEIRTAIDLVAKIPKEKRAKLVDTVNKTDIATMNGKLEALETAMQKKTA